MNIVSLYADIKVKLVKTLESLLIALKDEMNLYTIQM